MDQPSQPGAGSAWAPFRHRLFTAMWTAQFVSNIGSWMQTVGAQWLMLSLTGSAVYVALVQTAGSLPVMLFAVAAGAIGDLVDRRRFLLVAQGLMLVAAVALGALALAGLVTPWTLLALIFALGIGAALTAPTWQTLQPELVSPQERPQAISLGSVSQNLARAIGPAIGGVILAATSAGTVFLVNAVTFLAVIGVVAAWRSHRPPATLPREHIGDAIRAGGRYVAASPALRVILLRAFLFIFFASSIWALLPLTAKAALHLGSGGYGLLLGCVGVGAVAGALVLPKLRTLLPAGGQLTAGSLCLAARVGLTATLVTAAVALALGPLAGLRFRFQQIPPATLLPAGDWPPPPVLPAHGDGRAAADGPVMVTVEYRPRPGLREDLLTALRDARFSRRRTGASAWRVWQDATDPDRIVEQFVVASWDEHLRQHERVTRRDAGRFAAIRAMTDPDRPEVVTHWFTPTPKAAHPVTKEKSHDHS